MKRLNASVLKTNRPYFLFESVNNILISFGLHKSQKLLWLALCALEKGQRSEDPPFPPELEEHQWWMEQLTVGEAEDALNYADRAASLAYRYLRKKRNGR